MAGTRAAWRRGRRGADQLSSVVELAVSPHRALPRLYRRFGAGPTLLFSPYVTRRLPELWPDPLRFRPERWDPTRPGLRRPGPHDFLPFGGGPHRCLGAAFATTEITVLLEQLLRRTTLQLESADPRPMGLAAMRSRHGPFAAVLTVR